MLVTWEDGLCRNWYGTSACVECDTVRLGTPAAGFSDWISKQISGKFRIEISLTSHKWSEPLAEECALGGNEVH